MQLLPKSLRNRALAGAALIAIGGALPFPSLADEVVVGEAQRSATELVFYSGNLGQVSETRRVELDKGDSTLALEDVSPQLMVDSLLLQGADLTVLEQTLDNKVLSPQRLLEASLGKKVTIVRTNPETGEEREEEAEVLAVREGLVLRIGDRIETQLPGRIVYRELPDDLRAKPALLAEVKSGAAGDKDLSLSYLTSGLDWRVTYVAELNEEGTGLSLQGMATLTNQTGVDFENARIRLVAGEVNRVPQPFHAREGKAMMSAVAMEDAAAPAPQRQSLAERDVYTLPGTVDIGGREVKQVALLSSKAVDVERRFRFQNLIIPYGGANDTGRQHAQIVLKAENEEKSGLGKPLPAGTLRVYQQSADTQNGAASIFMGEDALPTTPVGEELELVIGSANQVTGRGTQTAFEKLSRNSYQLSQEIVLNNSGDKAVTVDVEGRLPGNWKILEESAKHKQENAGNVVWTIEVPAKGETRFDYTLRVSHEN